MSQVYRTSYQGMNKEDLFLPPTTKYTVCSIEINMNITNKYLICHFHSVKLRATWGSMRVLYPVESPFSSLSPSEPGNVGQHNANTRLSRV